MQTRWDVIIVGGGAAGLWAAGTAAERGRKVLVLEKNNKAGVKILMSGGTRCNITHHCDSRKIADAFGKNGRVLLSALSRLSPQDVVRHMYQEGVPFKGVLYAGVMLTNDGPFVLEFNTRFGDPETQSILPRLKTDLVEIMMASCDGRLNEISVKWDPRPCVCVVMTSGGYPGKYQNGYEIKGLAEPMRLFNAQA